MAQIENPSRERILSDIRQALRKPAPPLDGAEVSLDQIFTPISDVYQCFLTECKSNLIECIVTSSTEESAQTLATIVAAMPEGEIFLQDAPALREIAKSIGETRPLRWTNQGGPSESCQATVTLAEAFVAQTGSVLTSSHCGGRGASVVPPTHIVYGGASQILPDVTAAMRFAQREGIVSANSFVGLISGSSRTADIEKILVQGAHGPRRMVIILQRD